MPDTHEQQYSIATRHGNRCHSFGFSTVTDRTVRLMRWLAAEHVTTPFDLPTASPTAHAKPEFVGTDETSLQNSDLAVNFIMQSNGGVDRGSRLTRVMIEGDHFHEKLAGPGAPVQRFV